MSRRRKSSSPTESVSRYDQGVSQSNGPHGNPERLCEGLNRALGVDVNECLVGIGARYAETMADPTTQARWRANTQGKGQVWLNNLRNRIQRANLPAAR